MDNQLTALIDGFKPLQTTFWKGLVAGSINLSIGMLQSSEHPQAYSVVFGVILGALSYGASIALYIHSAQSLGATRSQMVFSSAPFFGLLLSFIILRESPTWMQGLSVLVIAGSIALLFRDKHSHRHKHAATEHIYAHRHDDGHHNHAHAGQAASLSHSHRHSHEPLEHAHPHWPDIHHRHPHSQHG